MSDEGSGGEKTEQPTDKKIRDAREKGQVAQSKELTMIVAMVVLVISLGFGYEHNLQAYSANSLGIYNDIKINNLGLDRLGEWLHHSTMVMLDFMLFPIILAAIISGIANIIQIKGLIISKEAFKFDMNKLNPVQNFKSTFSKKNFIKFVRQLIEIVIMSIVAFVVCKRALPDILRLYHLGVYDLCLFVALLNFKIFIILFFIHLVFSLADFVLEKIHLHKELMMSLHDIKEEYKSTEGNPEIKQKRRELHQELLADNPFGELANSSIVLANPTHIAIIIVYVPDKLKLPAIIAKTRGEKALELIMLAKKMGVPVVRDIWLARTLYEIGEIGKYVPKTMVTHIADLFGKNLHLMPELRQKIAMMATVKVPPSTQPGMRV